MPHDYDRYHTHHASRRLRGYDYTRPGVYFVTLCTHDRVCLFGRIVEGQMGLNEMGQIVEEEWRRSEAVRAEITLDAHVVMPNHVHGLVIIAPPGTGAPTDPRGYNAGLDVGANPDVASRGRATLRLPGGDIPYRKPKSLGAFVAGFKSAATKRINAGRGMPGAPVWQRGYHDRIIRTERAWHAVRGYIAANPGRWSEDAEHPDKSRKQ